MKRVICLIFGAGLFATCGAQVRTDTFCADRPALPDDSAKVPPSGASAGAVNESAGMDTAGISCNVPALRRRPVALRQEGAGLTMHEWLYGVGRTDVLDTYLSPLAYVGLSLSAAHRSERAARWGHGHWAVQGYYAARGAYLKASAQNHKEWDGELTAAVAWLRRWHIGQALIFAAGPEAQLSSGFTYNTANGNNPAQGRLSASVGVAALVHYRFGHGHHSPAVRSEVELPLAGAMFTPRYGQSYYEIFSLGHSDHNVAFTHPVNAPSVRWTTTLRLPLFGATLGIGYLADIRQSRVGGLKRHDWTNQLVIGYIRHLRLVR